MARALYIHWPFCVSKCPYCDFNSHVREQVDHTVWRDALLADMRHEAALAGREKLRSIFFGGGTPSLMPPALVDTLLSEAEKLWGFEHDVEITLEANPSSVEAANFADIAAAGVNRVSLGMQSLRDESLQFLGRMHSADEGLKALQTAQNAFDRVSFDLIYALPGHDELTWDRELREALELGTGHLSVYQLTIEPNTRFATMVRRGEFTPLDDDEAADLFTLTGEVLSDAGLPAYEISNHARPGEESQHNLTYWRYQDYIGIGPGAHGRRCGFATTRHRKPENYLSAMSRNGSGLQQERALGVREQASEALLMGLRLGEGVNLSELSARFGLGVDALVNQDEITRYQKLEYLKRDGERIRVTMDGMIVLDALLAQIVADDLVAA
ncbi:radical SAM family heme chaperone HemW [Aurantiacibacter sediminis]|uniref:Heme chaperone HemW n=1 Tax=Aurantiacibacter sediminis TaxID=2793064 RepID=A0ABS0N3T2_9SPHN|nr:radical SAM family heme chaperone HemW [Aurantiacibacter sediminis]MBH5322633.1 coproporphyrinogen III oxidase [Aurantiacibacter sediminis]